MGRSRPVPSLEHRVYHVDDHALTTGSAIQHQPMHALPTSLPARTSWCPAAAGAAVVVLALVASVPAGLACALAPAAAAAVVDVRSSRLPDELVAATAVIALVTALARAGGATDLVGAIGGAVVMAVPLLLLHLTSPAAMGFGDVKLAGALGLVVGLVDPRLGIVALCLASGLTAVVALLRRRSAVPFGPGLVTGAAVTVMAATIAGGWFTG